jgi:hypothetical protein
MRHGKKRTHRKRGGAWEDYLPSFLKAKPAPPAQIVNDPRKVAVDAQQVTEKTMESVVKPLGGTPEPTNTPGGMSAEAPAAAVLAGGRRHRKTRRKTRKSRRRH